MTTETATPAATDEAKPAAVIDPNETVGDLVADNPNPTVVADAPVADTPAPAKTDEPAAKPKTVSELRAEKLNGIAKRFQDSRKADAGPEFTGDFSDPEQTAGNFAKPKPEFDLTPEFIKNQGGDAPAEPAPVTAKPTADPAPAPKQFKLRVDGEEVARNIQDVATLADMTIEEVEANPERAMRYAQKELASSRRLDKAKEILRGATDSQRAPGSPDQDRTRTPAPNEDPENRGSPDQDDPVKKLVEDIQFGADPDEVATRLRDIITNESVKATRTTSLQDKARADLDHTLSVYRQIKADNTELFEDPYAEAAMQRILHDGYREDLRAIGLADEQIPSDTSKLIDAHRIARITGKPVRTAEKLLGDVKDKYVSWRGGAKPANPNPTPATPGQPRVVVDRTARREAIPSTPTPANAPPRVPSAPQGKKSREQIMQDMKRARGQVTAA